jgi:tetratricopeptide (TPR) repeat protein
MAGDEWQKWSELRPSVYGCYALPCDRQVGQGSKVEALALLEHLIKCEEAKENATIKLQKWTISCLATRKIRKDFILMKVAKKNAQAAVRIQRNLRIHFAKLEYSFMKRFRMAKQSAAIRIQARQRAIVARRETNAMRIGSKHSRKVLSIQKAYRGHVARVVFTERLNGFYRQEASKVACKIQTNIRQCLARRCLKKVKRSMIMMQQWAAQFSWKRTVDYLTKVAAKDWPTICAHTAASHGRKEAFTRAQILAPAVLPSWWLSHFPFALTKRVNLKREALAELDQQIRRDRINTLGGIGDFQDALNLLSSLADDLTGKARVTALNMSDSYDLLVSLIAFCNVRGTDMVSERNFTVSTQDSSLEKCRSFGIDMLKYAERLCDGPPLGLPGLTEKLAYKQWTYSNLCRVHCMLGDYSKAAEYGRMIETTRTGDTGRDDLVSIVSRIHIALVQSKLGKHNTSISMLQKASDRLVNWCENNSQRTWTSFCNTRILSRRYICTATHVAGVCQYNLSVEYAAVEQMDKALEAIKRACALASRDANSDPIFFRRCQRTLISLECISQVDSCVKRPLPLILQRLMQEESTVVTDNASESGRAQDERSRTPLSSSSVRSKVQTIKDFRESAEFLEATSDPALQVSRMKFGLWFPPHVALRLNIVDIVVAEHNDKEANSLFPASDPQETSALPSIFLRACPRVSSGVENAATRNQLLSGTLMLLALPMEETECLEILHADYIALQRIVRESNIKDGFRAVLRMKNSMVHAPAKMEQIVSVQIRNRMMGLVIISFQEASKFIIQNNNIQPDTATLDYAEKYVMLAESLLFSGAFDFKHFLEMKAYARLLHSLCFCLQV